MNKKLDPNLTPTPPETEEEHKCAVENCEEPRLTEKYCREHYELLKEEELAKWREPANA